MGCEAAETAKSRWREEIAKGEFVFRGYFASAARHRAFAVSSLFSLPGIARFTQQDRGFLLPMSNVSIGCCARVGPPICPEPVYSGGEENDAAREGMRTPFQGGAWQIPSNRARRCDACHRF